MRLGESTSVYLDSDALIRFVEGESDGLVILLENAAVDLLRLYSSEFTLAEVLVGPLKKGQRDLVGIYEDLLVSDEFLTIAPVSRAVLRRSAEIQATLGNKGPDAIHIATALMCNCTIFISSDERLKLPLELSRVRVDDVHADIWP